MVIEPAVAAAAARTASDEQCAWLRQIVEAEKHANLGHSATFHAAIATCSNNKNLAMMVTSLTYELTMHSTGENLSKADLAATQRAHRAVAKAIEEHDPARAEKAMFRHIERFRDLLAAQGRLDEPIVPRSHWLSQA